MIIKPSPLKLVQFFITRTEVSFSDPESYDNFDPESEINRYVIDVDFTILKPTKNDFHVFVKTDVNEDGELAGYEISAECLGIFQLRDKLPEDDVKKLINTSALVMALNYLRAHIANVTSPMPWNKYFLPSIDMQDLHAQKVQAIREMKGSKAKPAAKKKSNK